MRFAAVLNREGGTMRTLDAEDMARNVRGVLEAAGHEVEVRVVSGGEMQGALEAAFSLDEADAVMIAGGDGSVSCAAALAMNGDKALAILPAGTMNLFARSLGLPLDLDQALEAHAGGDVRRVDMGTANGRPFVHQFSIGMHAKLVKLRDQEEYGSRLGKMAASVRSGLTTLADPPRLRVALAVDGTRQVVELVNLEVSNNLFGEGHLPYADRLDQGVLGVYLGRTKTPAQLIRMVYEMAMGRWRDGEELETLQGRRVEVEILGGQRRFGYTLDGELLDLSSKTVIEIHPASLPVIVPKASEAA